MVRVLWDDLTVVQIRPQVVLGRGKLSVLFVDLQLEFRQFQTTYWLAIELGQRLSWQILGKEILWGGAWEEVHGHWCWTGLTGESFICKTGDVWGQCLESLRFSSPTWNWVAIEMEINWRLNSFKVNRNLSMSILCLFKNLTPPNNISFNFLSWENISQTHGKRSVKRNPSD